MFTQGHNNDLDNVEGDRFFKQESAVENNTPLKEDDKKQSPVPPIQGFEKHLKSWKMQILLAK